MNPQLQLATLVIAVLSLIIATSSFTWNVVQFLLAGSRPKAVLLVGALAPGGVVSGEPGPNLQQTLDRLAREDGYTQRVIGVRVVNEGRAPTRVQRWSVASDQKNAASFTPIGDLIGPDLPYTLEAGAQESWYVSLQTAGALVTTNAAVFGGPERPVHVVVELGNGKKLRTPQSVHVSG